MNIQKGICKKCNKEFFKKDFKDRGKKWNERKYCSLKCYWKGIDATQKSNFNPKRHSNEIIICQCGCGKEFKKYDSRGRLRKFFNFYHKPKGYKRPPFSEEWKKKISQSKTGIGRGANHWNWKGGISRKNHRRETVEYRRWRLEVFKRDWFTCQDCRIKHKNLVAHHPKSYQDFPELRYKVNNGITLCRSCHKKRHKEIGLETRFPSHEDKIKRNNIQRNSQRQPQR